MKETIIFIIFSYYVSIVGIKALCDSEENGTSYKNSTFRIDLIPMFGVLRLLFYVFKGVFLTLYRGITEE